MALNNTAPDNELAILVDENDAVLGYKDRYHLGPHDRMRMVVVWIENDAGEVLIHKRSYSKKVGPGLWENAAGGGVAKGESYKQAAYKELSEELGIDDVTLTFITKTQFISHNGPKMCAWFRGTTNISIAELTPNSREVSKVAWVDKAALLDKRDQNPKHYMPSSQYWRQLFQ